MADNAKGQVGKEDYHLTLDRDLIGDQSLVNPRVQCLPPLLLKH